MTPEHDHDTPADDTIGTDADADHLRRPRPAARAPRGPRPARLRGAHADPARGDPAAARRAGPARAGGHRHRQDRRLRAADAAAADAATAGARRARRAGPGADARARHAGGRGDPPLRPRPRAPACCRSTAGSRSGGSCRRCERGVDVVVATPGPRRSTTSRAAPSHLERLATVGARRGRRDARHGLRRGHRGDPARRPTSGRRCCSRPPCRRGSTDRQAAPAATRSRIQIGRGGAPPGEAPLVRQTAYVVPRAHKPAALGRILDVEAPTAAIVFCRTRDEVDELTETLNGRGYRAEALHGGMSQEQRDRVMGRLRSGHRRPARRHRRRRPRARHRAAHPRRQLRRAVGPRGLRAPHRPGRPGRARGRGDHPGRAARAPAAQEHRAGHRPADRRSRRSRRSPTCAPGGWS